MQFCNGHIHEPVVGGYRCVIDPSVDSAKLSYGSVGQPFDGVRHGLIVSVQPDWFGTGTRVVALFLPNDVEKGV